MMAWAVSRAGLLMEGLRLVRSPERIDASNVPAHEAVRKRKLSKRQDFGYAVRGRFCVTCLCAGLHTSQAIERRLDV